VGGDKGRQGLQVRLDLEQSGEGCEIDLEAARVVELWYEAEVSHAHMAAHAVAAVRVGGDKGLDGGQALGDGAPAECAAVELLPIDLRGAHGLDHRQVLQRLRARRDDLGDLGGTRTRDGVGRPERGRALCVARVTQEGEQRQ